jgi:hypothetical protein
VAQVIGAPGEPAGDQLRAEGEDADGLPGTAVDRSAERPAADSPEQPAVGCRALGRVVLAKQADQHRRDRDHPDRPVGPVLEPALFIAGAVAGPCGGRPGRGQGQSEHAPPGAGQVAVGEAQGDGFLRADRGVVQAAEEGGQLRPRPATISSSALTCSGLATTAGSRAADDCGTRQAKLSTGLSGSRPASAA